MPPNSLHILPLSARYMMLSALGFALMAVCVKEVSTYGIPVMEIIAARAIVSLIISYLDVKRKGISLWGLDKPLLIARGVVGALALICVYYAITTLPLAEATLIQYLHPAFTAIIALIFLREHLHLSTIICIVLSIAGLAIIVQPGQLVGELNELPLFSVIIAIMGALGSAIAYVLVRKLSQSEDSSVVIFYFPLVALPVACLFPGESFVMPDLPALILLILVGIFTQVGQVGLTKAMQTEGAGKATAYSYVQVIFALILGWVIFAEIPSLWTWLGGSLIIAGAFINIIGCPLNRASRD
ncbi:MAG: EamA family transporter [Thiotrichales bacterium]|nr:MAG: EamA family transporter [Thiotrichales bacterium]